VGRRPLNLRPFSQTNPHKHAGDLVETVNIHPYFSLLISNGLATLHELKTVYDMRDVYDLLEIIQVNDYNRTLLSI